MSFKFSDYWPQPEIGKTVTFDYGVGADGKSLVSTYTNSGDSKVFYLDDYVDGQWKDRWVLDYFTDRGILETADVYPAHSYQFWTSRRTTAFIPGYEIPWGNEQEVGDRIDREICISLWRSTPIEWCSQGRQVVEFVKQQKTFTAKNGLKYKDVLEVTYDQSFGGKPSVGNRGWYAKGIGLVQLTWRSEGNDVGNPMPATVKVS